MLRVKSWGGLITAASPYVVPPGGSVEQINAQSLFPGQLSVRGGMTPVSTEAPMAKAASGNAILEMWGYATGSGDTETIFAFTDQGQIIQIKNPRVEYET
jgi:hypothetical protein